MRFFGYILGDESVPIPPPTPVEMAHMGGFIEEAMKAGVLIATGGVAPLTSADRPGRGAHPAAGPGPGALGAAPHPARLRGPGAGR